MKKALILLLLAPVFAMSQISEPVKHMKRTTVGKVSTMGTTFAELQYTVNEEDITDTAYVFRYKNSKYTHISDYKYVVFSGVDGTKRKLYEAFKSVFLPENIDNKDYTISFKLGSQDVSITNFSTMGIKGAGFFGELGSYIVLSSKQIDKLFDEKE